MPERLTIAGLGPASSRALWGIGLPGAWLCCLPWLAPSLVQAQDAAGAGAAEGGGGAAIAWRVRPRFSATETITDNAVVAAGSRQADQITQLSPGVRIEGTTARLRMFADYSLSYFTAARRTQADRSTNTLNSFATLEAIDRWLYLDASAVVTQQNISAFGAQTAGTTTVSANTTETTTFRLSPYVRGSFARLVDYDARYSHSETRSKSQAASGAVTDSFALNLRGRTGPVGLGWSANASRQTAQYGSDRTSRADLVRGTLLYRFAPEFQLRASGGWESNDYAGTATSRSTFGYGADWSPTPRTQLTAFRERRTFGDSHTITFNHRMPMTVLRFTDRRDVTILPNQLANVGQGTYYDLLFAQLAGAIPDPVARAQQVASQLQQAGIAPNAAITSGFLTSRVSVQRRQELSLVLNGLRNTVTYTLFQSDQRAAAAGAALADDFSTNSSFKQRGMSSNLSHRLSPLTSLNAFSSWLQSEGAAGQSTISRSFNLNASTRLGARTSANVGVRAIRNDGGAVPYRENAMFASVTAQF